MVARGSIYSMLICNMLIAFFAWTKTLEGKMPNNQRTWRKTVRKLRRSRLRKNKAKIKRDHVEPHDQKNESSSSNEMSAVEDAYELSEETWKKREEQIKYIHLERMKGRITNDRLGTEENAQSIEDWQKNKEDRENEEANKTIEAKESDEFLDSLCGDIENPPVPYVMPTSSGVEACKFFRTVGACRFYNSCKYDHPRPILSQIILIPNFFSHLALDNAFENRSDMDFSLEYDDHDVFKSFREFYWDVRTEFDKYGKVTQFKVCCNLEPHLRGNVYVQFSNIREALDAIKKFNGRYYGGKQLSCAFVKIDSWSRAVCGSYLRKTCPNGPKCNYLHLFRNPRQQIPDTSIQKVTKPSCSDRYEKGKSSTHHRIHSSAPSARCLPYSSHRKDSVLEHKSRHKKKKHKKKKHKKDTEHTDSGQRKKLKKKCLKCDHKKKRHSKSEKKKSISSEISSS